VWATDRLSSLVSLREQILSLHTLDSPLDWSKCALCRLIRYEARSCDLVAAQFLVSGPEIGLQ
jgi:hypothetical protein